jgi:hypothetical protein
VLPRPPTRQEVLAALPGRLEVLSLAVVRMHGHWPRTDGGRSLLGARRVPLTAREGSPVAMAQRRCAT